MFVVIIGLAIIIGPIYGIIAALAGSGKKSRPSSPPARKNPIDKHMDDNYADIDWLRKGKL